MSSIKIYKDENYDFSDCELSFDKNSYIVSFFIYFIKSTKKALSKIL